MECNYKRENATERESYLGAERNGRNDTVIGDA
jgi:hypothetical protein